MQLGSLGFLENFKANQKFSKNECVMCDPLVELQPFTFEA